MDKFVIDGQSPLQGEVTNSGAKNCVLLLMAATLLTEDDCIIENVPTLRDVKTLSEILRHLGKSVEREKDTLYVRHEDSKPVRAPYDLVRKMRASVCVLGPLLARRQKAEVSMPGGCVIGVRPIDLHIKGLRKLNANITIEEGYIRGQAPELQGNEIYLGGHFGSTVTGTANVLMASVLAEGTTVIDQAACEPEVQALAHFLNEMGANIEGIGSHRLVIEGVNRLGGTQFASIPDRIEAGTFLIGGALHQEGSVTVTDTNPRYVTSLIQILEDLGCRIEKGEDWIQVSRDQPIQSTKISTLPYPGFPTDLQAQMMTLLTQGKGVSIITEKIYPDRFMHVPELNRMGARIQKEGDSAIIEEGNQLSGAEVMASDLRASAALVLAGFAASGTTHVHRIYHIDRGYERIEEKLESLGAQINRVKDEQQP